MNLSWKIFNVYAQFFIWEEKWPCHEYSTLLYRGKWVQARQLFNVDFEIKGKQIQCENVFLLNFIW